MFKKGVFVEDFISYPLSSLPGVGPRTRSLLKRLVGETLLDLLFFFPTRILERHYFPSILEFLKSAHTLKEDSFITFVIHVASISKPARRGGPIKVRVSDSTGEFDVMFFNSNFQYLQRKLGSSETILISGKPTFYGRKFQINHPDYMGPVASLPDFKGPSPIYPLTQGLSNKVVAHVAQTALKMTPTTPEWISSSLLEKKGWPSWKEALTQLHSPTPKDFLPTSPARQRLAYDELLAQQLTLLLSRHLSFKKIEKTLSPSSSLSLNMDSFLKSLPFELTSCQNRVLKEITEDLQGESRMLRLLQGDVGTGKTIVSFLIALHVLSRGKQIALLAPTEILAQQHFKTLTPWAESLNISLDMLTGSFSQRKQGKDVKTRLKDGEISFIIGTHALLEEDVIFKDLGLVIVDEQHRFGVEQRLKLFKKGKESHILAMSATPIPRTLQLVNFGDMNVSHLHEKPKNRKPITTRALPLDRLEDVINSMSRILEKGQRVYWICPLISESEVLDLTAAQERFSALQKIFGEHNVGLLHGKMKPLEKEASMRDFATGAIQILVSTTVIEVGIDVKEATLMVIEHAERFGLSQLHQLRGRVGRGEDASSCLLLYAPPLNDIARQRLNILRETNDGFKIAEEDLRLRGSGDLLGVHQSGYDIFKIADLYEHKDLLEMAQKEARLIFEKDPHLISERGKKLRSLLGLFNRLHVLEYLTAG